MDWPERPGSGRVVNGLNIVRTTPAALKVWEKSPCLSRSLGSVLVMVDAVRLRRPSKAVKKNVRFFPLYNFGNRTGPPMVAPNSLRLKLPSLTPRALLKKLLESTALFRK